MVCLLFLQSVMLAEKKTKRYQTKVSKKGIEGIFMRAITVCVECGEINPKKGYCSGNRLEQSNYASRQAHLTVELKQAGKAKFVKENYLSPKRKFKNKCKDCGKSCIGIYCYNCFQNHKKDIWTIEKRRAHRELMGIDKRREQSRRMIAFWEKKRQERLL